MNCTTEYRSSSRFSSGVPVRTRANGDFRPLMTRAGLRLPVLDPLAFVEDDQVPADALDGQDVAEHLLVVADGEEAVVVVLPGPLGGAADDQLHVAVGRSGGSRSATAT